MDENSTKQHDINDIEDARRLGLKKIKLLGRRDFVMDCIALIVVIGFFSIAFTMAFAKIDQENHDVVYMLLGQLSAGFIGVLSFFFGNIRRP